MTTANMNNKLAWPWKVLVYPGGTEIGLEINRALRDCKEVELYSASENVPSAAEARFERHFYIKNILHKDAIDELNKLVIDHKIDYIFPAHDEILVNISRFRDKIAAHIVTSEKETCEITRSKSLTYKFLKDVVPVPEVYGPHDNIQFPVFVKPDKGQGSAGAKIINNKIELESAIASTNNLIISEFLPGREFTVDCFSSHTHGVVFAQGRERIRMRAGIAMQSKPVHDPEFIRYARFISSKLSLRGSWFFQVKYDKDNILKLLEVAPRIAGTMALNRVTGVNFPLMSLYDAAGYDVKPIHADFDIEITRSLDNHYKHSLFYSCVYIDLDDTLIIKDKVNTRIIRFIYQCINEKKPVYLITRHNYNIKDTLERHRLQTLFDKIIHITDDTCKSEYIIEDDAIFIDDSFKERLNVFTKKGIICFENSSVECLINDRA